MFWFLWVGVRVEHGVDRAVALVGWLVLLAAMPETGRDAHGRKGGLAPSG